MDAQVLEFPGKTKSFQMEYEKIVNMASDLFGLTPAEKQRMTENLISQIVVKLPFLAKCKNPERTALAHIIITYAASHTSCKSIFLHTLADDESIFSRLECINQFEGGDHRIIKSGMNLLALLMLSDHRNDRLADMADNKYNPVSSGAWKIDDLREQLLREIREYNCPEMAYLPGDDDVRQANWEFP